jgi:hypothetical protein
VTIGRLLHLAAPALAAHALRLAVRESALTVTMVFCAVLAVGAGAFCLSGAAYILLERRIDAAGALAVLGLLWGASGLCYLVAVGRRR